MTTENSSPVFDYRALRLLVGIIAFALPFTVSLISSISLSSISASYYTEARDVFVGMLFIVGSFLWAYNGHSTREAIASKLAAIAAILVAVFPTACDNCDTGLQSIVHYISAASLFIILAYFCFGPFRKNTKGQKGKKGRRSKIYFICGCIMVICIICAGLGKIVLPEETLKGLRLTYWAELIALAAFGVAWITAGKYLRPLVDKEDALKLFGK